MGDGPLEQAFANAKEQIVLNKDVLDELVTDWIVENNISFRTVGTERFRRILRYVCITVSSILVPF